MADGEGFGNLPPNFLRDFAYLQQQVRELQLRQLPETEQNAVIEQTEFEWLRFVIEDATEEGPPGDDAVFIGTASWSHHLGVQLMDLTDPEAPRFGQDGDYSITFFSNVDPVDDVAQLLSLITLETPDTDDLPDLTNFNFQLLFEALLPVGLGGGLSPTVLVPPFPFANQARIITNYLTQLSSTPDPVDIIMRLLIIKTK